MTPKRLLEMLKPYPIHDKCVEEIERLQDENDALLADWIAERKETKEEILRLQQTIIGLEVAATGRWGRTK